MHLRECTHTHTHPRRNLLGITSYWKEWSCPNPCLTFRANIRPSHPWRAVVTAQESRQRIARGPIQPPRRPRASGGASRRHGPRRRGNGGTQADGTAAHSSPSRPSHAKHGRLRAPEAPNPVLQDRQTVMFLQEGAKNVHLL